MCILLKSPRGRPSFGFLSLWANVMLEYTLEEARTLLQKNITQAKEASDVVDEDLGFLRDQTTTTEVSMARVYNWNVKRRLETKKLASSGESGEASV
ncbi:VBP1 [Bugula neritina]|uniref:VBP1 n=1 Tax=Bugula neritina TaxID=10212 RepID=A0A7J7KDK9_BUGNE|nr:VBP1 [Bugula neritina]